jgi:hypothetical protein
VQENQRRQNAWLRKEAGGSSQSGKPARGLPAACQSAAESALRHRALELVQPPCGRAKWALARLELSIWLTGSMQRHGFAL